MNPLRLGFKAAPANCDTYLAIFIASPKLIQLSPFYYFVSLMKTVSKTISQCLFIFNHKCLLNSYI